jgi:hypothetical protein
MKTKKRIKTIIQLSNEVVVSDPCYTVPTWCQVIVKDVKEGNYIPFALESDVWGGRISALCVIHEEHADVNSNLQWEEHGGTIGVDSGQCGIFSKDSYRKDNIFKIKPKFEYSGKEDGDKWYAHMCDKTLSDNMWGAYGYGVVSSSGIGDGSYDLYTLIDNDEKVVGFFIDYLIDEDIDLDFWKAQL